MALLQVLFSKRREKMKQLSRAIPHVMTLVNALCGFLAIIKAVEGELLLSAYYIIIAACIDGLDGRVARALSCSSDFGCELDSLADAVSFCGAPMVIMYQWIPGDLGLAGSILLGLYVCAGLWRLAKFNTCTKESHSFVGLPTTVAALTIALLIIYEPWVVSHAGPLTRQPSLLALVCVLGWLMVSPISFTKINRYPIKRGYKGVVVGAVLASFAAHLYGFPLLLLAATIYIFFALFSAIARSFFSFYNF